VDGKLRISYRRTFGIELMQSWNNLIAVVESITLKEETDALIWSYQSSGVYSSSSLYSIINFTGGLTHLYTCYIEHLPSQNTVIFVAAGT
jgi:hypothetical protein